MIQPWSRVKIFGCSGSNVVHVWRYKPGEKPHKDIQIFDDIIGVTIPLEHKRPGVIVSPLEYHNRGQWTKYYPGYCYFRVKEEDMQLLGRASVEEIARTTMSIRALGLGDMESPLQIALRKLRRRRNLHGLKGDFKGIDRPR